MTPEEMNRTIEFLIQHSATFSGQLDDLKALHERDHKFLVDLTQQTARFESWAAEVVSIESRRLDEHDRLHQDTMEFQNEALRLLHRILDRLPEPS
jgi:hypothetical protein